MGKPRKPKARSRRRARGADERSPTPAVAEPGASYTVRPRAAAERLPADLAPHAAELKRLVAFIDLAKGFALAFAECNFAPLRQAVIEEVRRRCDPSVARIDVLDLGDAQDISTPLNAIVSRVPEVPAGDEAPKRILMVTGLEAHVGITDRQPPVLVALNLARDAFPSRLREPLIFWLPDYLLTTLSRVAPDFWAWANGTFRFPAPEPLRERAFNETLRADTRILDSQVEDVKARIRVLESLLQEYLPSVGEPPADRLPGALDILNELGAGYWGLGDSRQAIRYLTRMLELARETGNRQAEGVAHGNLGNAYYDLGEPRKAIEQQEQHLKIAREIGDRRGEGSALGNLGIAYGYLGETRQAIELHEQRLAIARELGDRRSEGNALGDLGNAYHGLGETRKAIQLQQQCLAIARQIGGRRGEGTALGNLGTACAALGEPREAIEHYEQALAIARQIGHRRAEGNALGGLGNAYYDLGETLKAIEHYELHLKIAREIGDRRGEGNALGNLGNAYYDLGETLKAIEHYEKQLKIAREIGDRHGEGNALGSLGNAYDALGETSKAIEHYEKQLMISREIGDRHGEAMGSWNLGLACEKEADLPRAVELMQVLVDYERELGHADAKKHAARVERLRKKMEGGGKRR